MSPAADIRDPSAPRPATTPKVLVLDLDGTCLDREVRLHPRIRAAVRSAVSNLPVIIATGRMYRSTLPWAYELGVREPLVCYQGAMVRTMPDDGNPMGELLFEDGVDATTARTALRVARAHDWQFQAYQDDELLCERDRPEARMYSRISGMPFRIIPDLDPLLERGSTKLACVVIEDPDEVDRAIGVMAAALGDAARVTRSSPEFVEIVNPRVSKATACDLACRRLGCTLRDAVAIGDAPNDIEMLEASGFGVAVAGARPEVIAAAAVTCAAPEDGGVADALEALGLA